MEKNTGHQATVKEYETILFLTKAKMDLDEKLTGCSWRVRSSGSELDNRSSKCLSHFKQRKVG